MGPESFFSIPGKETIICLWICISQQFTIIMCMLYFKVENDGLVYYHNYAGGWIMTRALLSPSPWMFGHIRLILVLLNLDLWVSYPIQAGLLHGPVCSVCHSSRTYHSLLFHMSLIMSLYVLSYSFFFS